MTLHDYLSQLNTSDDSFGVWVSPENIDDYRVGQRSFDNGGLLDDKVYVGSLDDLSFGSQSDTDAFYSFLDIKPSETQPTITWRDATGLRKAKVNPEALHEAWLSSRLGEAMQAALSEGVAAVQETWIDEEVSNFISDILPERIAAVKEEVYA